MIKSTSPSTVSVEEPSAWFADWELFLMGRPRCLKVDRLIMFSSGSTANYGTDCVVTVKCVQVRWLVYLNSIRRGGGLVIIIWRVNGGRFREVAALAKKMAVCTPSLVTLWAGFLGVLWRFIFRFRSRCCRWKDRSLLTFRKMGPHDLYLNWKVFHLTRTEGPGRFLV